MNGRMYDPVIGRFLSPDSYVQAPDYAQNFNWYAYCLNNPLVYVDETGEFWHIVIGAAIGGVVNLATNLNNIDNFGQGLAYFGVGAAAGALGAMAGGAAMSLTSGCGFVGSVSTATINATATGFVQGAAVGGATGLFGGYGTGFGNSLLGGNSFGSALGDGLVSGGIGGLTGGVLGGIGGGINACRQGGNFWNGDPWEVQYDYKLPGTVNSPNGDLPIHQQANPEVGCTQETFESIAEYGGENLNLDKNTGADFRELALSEGYSVKTNNDNYVHSIGREMLRGNPSAITYDNGGIYHTVGINKITVSRTTKLFGNGYRFKNIIQVMDPLYSTYQRLSYSSFKLMSNPIRTIYFK